MKKISLYLLVLFTTLLACEKDETMVMLSSDATPPKITSQASGFSQVITEETLSSALKFDWTKTGYGVNTEVSYTLQVDSKCGTFTNPVVIGTTTANTLSVTLDNLNDKLVNSLKIAPHQASDVQVRVISTINNNHLAVSDPVVINVKPWNDMPVGLWIGANSTSALKLYATAENVFEGFRYLTEGSSFYFTTNPVCSETVFGDGGSGKLATGSSSPKINIASTGFYRIKADTKNLVYEIVPISWGLIGTATSGGWSVSTDMAFNTTTGQVEVEAELAVGALKFRADNAWTYNYGTSDVDALAGDLVFDAASVNIAEQGKYKVSLDFSQALSPYGYKYTITRLGDVTEPSKVWIPGSYQDWNPAAAPVMYAYNNKNDYEGYLNLTVGAGFKFTSAPDWTHINYGESEAGRTEDNYGTGGVKIIGSLSIDGEKPGVSLSTPAYYRLKINTTDLTYRIDKIASMGLIGTSVAGGWEESTPMTYDAANNVWKVTANLVPGALKFRANNVWDINYGVADSNSMEGGLIFDEQAAININDAGSYTVTLDFSPPTASPYRFKYSVKKN